MNHGEGRAGRRNNQEKVRPSRRIRLRSGFAIYGPIYGHLFGRGAGCSCWDSY